MLSFITQLSEPRPSITSTNKDKDYHAKWARFCVGSAFTQQHTDFIDKTKKNKRFYAGHQWEGSEDIELFLRDENNDERNRLNLTNNIIRPMVEQYRGNAIRMGINFRVKSISPQVINRREQARAKALFLSRQANSKAPDGTPNPFAAEIRSKYPVGENDAQTVATFENTYIDTVVKKINNLCEFVEQKNEFEDKQVTVAEQLAFSGIGVMKNYARVGHQFFKVVQSETFFFDRTAKEYNLSDAGFMGEVTEMWPQEIFEMWPDISDEDKQAIEEYSRFYSQVSNQVGRNYGTYFTTAGKVPVFITYWKDGQYEEYGYVKDEYGYDYFTKINYTYEGEDKPRYTDADLIKNNSIQARKVLKGALKRTMFTEVIRSCTMIPKEILASAKKDGAEAVGDVVLEWGPEEYQEVEVEDFTTSKFPYKCYCWGYIDGEILSPIDDAIDPQRFINRIWSVAENQINNSGGANILVDSSMVDDQAELVNNMNNSKPIFLNAKGRSIQNAVTPYDRSVKNGTLVLYNLIEATKGSLKQTTGVNEALQGESTGSDQLVGVTQLMIQRGSLMQEPFYNAITLIFKQCYQAIITRGKRIYYDSQRNLAIAVGDDGAQAILINHNDLLEDMRIFVKRENPDEILINAANQTLLLFKQLGLLDDMSISNLWGRSTPDEVASALREWAKKKQELQKMSVQQQTQQQQKMAEGIQQQNQQQQFNLHNEQARQDIKDYNDKKAEVGTAILKEIGKIAPHNQQAQQMILDAGKNNLQNNRI